MLKAAQNYITQIQEKYAECMYDLNYQWYFGYRGTALPQIDSNNYNDHKFASVDKDGNVIGYISYCTNDPANSCYNFGAISFNKGNIEFVRDIKQALDDIFYKYNFDRIEFCCFDGNPVLRNYRNFIKRHGGREIGIYKRCNRLMDGKLYDSVAFEILKEDYIK